MVMTNFVFVKMKGETIAAIVIIVITIVILLVYLLFVYVASSRAIYPFTEYVMSQPPNSAIVGANQQPLTQQQIDDRKQIAIDVCNYLAESQNFMTMYCGQQPTNKIDCSMLQG